MARRRHRRGDHRARRLVDRSSPRRRGGRGYAAGDAEIQLVSQALQRLAVRCGGTAARYSGRHFALLVPGADAAAAELLADQFSDELGDGGPAVPPPARVQLGFRDGTSTALDPESDQSQALQELARSLVRRD